MGIRPSCRSARGGERVPTGARFRYGTQAAFKKFKRDFDRRLQAAGIHQLKPKNLKPKHIKAVVEQLRAEVESGTRSTGAAKNWLAHLRAYVRLIDRRIPGAPHERRTGLRKPGLRAL